LRARDLAAQEADRLAKLAVQRGLVDKATALGASLQRLHARAQEVGAMLAMVSAASS